MTIMLVDDEPQILAGLSEMVRRQCPFVRQIICAQDGVDALEILEEQGIGELDLVISDIYLPEMNGFELINAITARGVTSRFIIISGYDDFKLAREAIKNRVIDYLVKPINAKELVALLARVHDEVMRAGSQKRKAELDRFTDLLKYRVDWEDMFVSEATLREVLPGGRFTFFALHARGAEAVGPVARRLRRFITAPHPKMLFTMPYSSDVVMVVNSDAPLEENLLGHYRVLKGQLQAEGLVQSAVRLEAAAGFEALGRHLQSVLAALVYRQSLQAEGAPQAGPMALWEKDLPVYDLASLEKGRQPPRQELERAVEAYLDGLPAEALASPAALRAVWLKNQASLRAARQQNDPADPGEKPGAALPSPGAGIQSRAALAAHLANAVDSYARSFTQALSRTPSSSILEIKNYIDGHYSEQIRLEQVARLVYKHPNYVSARFRQEMGMTFIQYLHHIRIEKAKALLKQDPDISMELLAERTGFDNVNYLFKVFKKLTGVTPGSYRRAPGAE